MKNSLNKLFIWGGIFLFLQDGVSWAQPIQLIPQKGEEGEQIPIGVPVDLSQSLPEFWEGTPPSVLEIYFPKIPLSLTSPVLRHLRSELTKEKYTELLKNAVYEDSFFSILIASGKWEQAKEFLMDSTLGDQDTLLVDVEWLTGESKRACEKITNLFRTTANPEWKKQNIYCLYLNGEEERAKIAVEVLSESNPTSAKLLNTLFDSSRKVPLDDIIANSPFLLTVWLESKQEIPGNQLNKLPSSSLALIARFEKAPFTTRLLAGEKALRLGTFKPEDFLTLLKNAPETEFWGQFAEALNSPKAEKLLPLFERASQDHKLGLVAQVFVSPLSDIDPSEEMLPLAPFMIRAFLQSERKELAKKWGTFFMREAPEEAIAFLPLLHLAFPEIKWGDGQMQAWQAYENRMHPTTAAQHSYELRRILEALAKPVGQPMKNEPSPPSWRQEKALVDEKEIDLLNSAAESKRKGEVILLVLTMIGSQPLQQLSVDKLVLLLKPLQKAGFKEEARLLGLEFLLAKNSPSQ